MSNSIKENIIIAITVLLLPVLTYIPYVGWLFSIAETFFVLLGTIAVVQNFEQLKEKALSLVEKVKALIEKVKSFLPK
jgi:hypothetical protein